MTYIEGGKPTPPGEGWLTYPGAEVGSDSLVPSIRLKWVRKSVEDYEYVEILKKLHRGDWALSLVRSVAADWTHWSHDADALKLSATTGNRNRPHLIGTESPGGPPSGKHH